MTETAEILGDVQGRGEHVIDELLAEGQAECHCPNCGKRWHGTVSNAVIRFLGITQGVVRVWCSDCESADRNTPRRSSVPPPVDLSGAWASLCPDEYRLTPEGGRTDRDRLRRAWGQRPDLTRMTAGQICDLAFGHQPILLAGKPGTMKTRLAWRMVRMVWERSQSVRCFSSWQFQAQLQEAGGGHTSFRWMADLMKAELVFIDDLGKAEWTANTHGAFFELLEARIARRKPLLITTNETFATLQEARADHRAAVAQSSASAIIRRFREYAVSVVMQTT